jgi:hypothetical protein
MEQIRLQDSDVGEVVFQGKLLGEFEGSKIFEKEDGGFVFTEKVGDGDLSVESYEDAEILCICLLDCFVLKDEDMDKEIQCKDLLRNSVLLQKCEQFDELVERRRDNIQHAIDFMVERLKKKETATQ